ncbi:MAG: YebC/PmpR family DNA-binding transcriptional regulator, partial [Coriobacteriales bacterium]
MSGHSKWATTKHRKAAQDKKRSALFSKLSRIVYVAAKAGGPDPANNAALAAAIEKARSYSLPKDKIDAAIKKAAGAGEGESYEEVVYEGYGANGVAIYIEALTDNRNRTAADIRSAFTRAGGNLAATGAVAFQFERVGEIVIDKATAPDEEELLLLVAEAGGEDLEDNDEEFVVLTRPADVMRVKDALVAAGVSVKGAELTMRPITPVAVDLET